MRNIAMVTTSAFAVEAMFISTALEINARATLAGRIVGTRDARHLSLRFEQQRDAEDLAVPIAYRDARRLLVR
ncbi:MAG: hypothetical protein HRU01_14795 [Myxococcales bacterium]|nr:hypothetical protein [Myxococcales bacterium]